MARRAHDLAELLAEWLAAHVDGPARRAFAERARPFAEALLRRLPGRFAAGLLLEFDTLADLPPEPEVVRHIRRHLRPWSEAAMREATALARREPTFTAPAAVLVHILLDRRRPVRIMHLDRRTRKRGERLGVQATTVGDASAVPVDRADDLAMLRGRGGAPRPRRREAADAAH